MDYKEINRNLFEVHAVLLAESVELTEAASAIAQVISDEDLEGQNDVGAADAFFSWLESIVARLADHGLNEEKSWELLFAVAAVKEEDGMMPEMPNEESDDAEFNEWIAAAKSSGFEEAVYRAAE